MPLTDDDDSGESSTSEEVSEVLAHGHADQLRGLSTAMTDGHVRVTSSEDGESSDEGSSGEDSAVESKVTTIAPRVAAPAVTGSWNARSEAGKTSEEESDAESASEAESSSVSVEIEAAESPRAVTSAGGSVLATHGREVSSEVLHFGAVDPITTVCQWQDAKDSDALSESTSSVSRSSLQVSQPVQRPREDPSVNVQERIKTLEDVEEERQKRAAEDEQRRREEEEQRRAAEEEGQRREEERQRRVAEEEQRQRDEEQQRRLAENEQRRIDEERQRKVAEEKEEEERRKDMERRQALKHVGEESLDIPLVASRAPAKVQERPRSEVTAERTRSDRDAFASEVDTQQQLREIFDRCDRNGDGKVNKRELIKELISNKDIADMLNLPQRIRQEDGSRDQFERIFQGIDVNDDREIHWPEFEAFFAAYAGPRDTGHRSPKAPDFLASWAQLGELNSDAWEREELHKQRMEEEQQRRQAEEMEEDRRRKAKEEEEDLNRRKREIHERLMQKAAEEKQQREAEEQQKRLQEERARQKESEERQKRKAEENRRREALEREAQLKKEAEAKELARREEVFWAAMTPEEADRMRGMLQAVTLYKQQVQQNEQVIVDVQKQVADRQQGYRDLRKQIQFANEDTSRSREREAQAREEQKAWSRKRRQYAEAGEDAQSLRAQCGAAQADCARLRKQVAPKKAEVAALRQRIATCQEAETQQVSRLSDLRSRCHQAVAALQAEQVEEVATLRAQHTEELSRLEANLSGQLAELRSRYSEESSGLRGELEDATRRREQLRRDRDDVADQLRERQREGTCLQRQCAEARQDVLDLSAQAKAHEALSRCGSATRLGVSFDVSTVSMSMRVTGDETQLQAQDRQGFNSELRSVRRRCKHLERECKQTHDALEKKQVECERWRKRSFDEGSSVPKKGQQLDVRGAGIFTLGPTEAESPGITILGPTGSPL